jgi:hypothetical protein
MVSGDTTPNRTGETVFSGHFDDTPNIRSQKIAQTFVVINAQII